MDIFEQYSRRANEIIGERSKDEVRYDNEVLRWVRKGKPIKKAIKLKLGRQTENGVELSGTQAAGKLCLGEASLAAK